MAVNAVGVGVLAAGAVLLWSGIGGRSVLSSVQDIIKGQKPRDVQAYPINDPGTGSGGSGGSGSASGGTILQIAASFKGRCYSFGGGHGSPCGGSCWDCSGYVSCVLNKAGVLKGTLATGGLSTWGVGVSYANRQPGDIIVWNGGTGGGHVGIIATVSGNGGTMWNNPCTGCGGVKLSNYPEGGARSAANAVVRRAKSTSVPAVPAKANKGTPGGATTSVPKLCKDPVSGGWVDC